MNDPSAEIILNKYGGNWDDAEDVAKQIRQQIGRELLKRSPMNLLAGMAASEILINKEQAYELGWNEAKQLFREVCQMDELKK